MSKYFKVHLYFEYRNTTSVFEFVTVILVYGNCKKVILLID